MKGPSPRQVDRARRWTNIQGQLARAREVLGRAQGERENAGLEILKNRASLAAEPPRDERQDAAKSELVVFCLAHEEYALSTEWILEVAPLREYAPLPASPSFVLGVTALRGRMLAVLDLRRLFQLPDPGITDLNRVIVLSDLHMEFGVLADSVSGVCSLSLDALSPMPPTITGVRATLSRGIGPDGLIVLDAEAMLTAPELIGEDGG